MNIVYRTNIFSSSLSLSPGGGMCEVRFMGGIKNTTVTLGRDASLSCTVEGLGIHQVILHQFGEIKSKDIYLYWLLYSHEYYTDRNRELLNEFKISTIRCQNTAHLFQCIQLIYISHSKFQYGYFVNSGRLLGFT